jgi:hypothetical protein
MRRRERPGPSDEDLSPFSELRDASRLGAGRELPLLNLRRVVVGSFDARDVRPHETTRSGPQDIRPLIQQRDVESYRQ